MCTFNSVLHIVLEKRFILQLLQVTVAVEVAVTGQEPFFSEHFYIQSCGGGENNNNLSIKT